MSIIWILRAHISVHNIQIISIFWYVILDFIYSSFHSPLLSFFFTLFHDIVIFFFHFLCFLLEIWKQMGDDHFIPNNGGCANYRMSTSSQMTLCLVRSQERLKIYHSMESTFTKHFLFSKRNDKLPGHKIKVNLYQALLQSFQRWCGNVCFDLGWMWNLWLIEQAVLVVDIK